jgi:hypothetical protein
VIAQDPTVTIVKSEPEAISNVLIESQRDQDVTLDCYVENLPKDTVVSTCIQPIYCICISNIKCAVKFHALQ